MTRSTIITANEFYHIYNRGTEKRKIFLTKSDYERFLTLLYLANNTESVDLKRQGSTLSEFLDIDRKKPLVNICAYCLMPNHFHLILQGVEDGGISKFMQKLVTGYTMYFNKINERNGSLFQGRFKAEHAEDDRYLKYLISYVHLNPVKLIDSNWKEAGIRDKKAAAKFLDTYAYSSFPDYCGIRRKEVKILNTEALPKYTETPKDFRSMVTDWLDGQGSTLSE